MDASIQTRPILEPRTLVQLAAGGAALALAGVLRRRSNVVARLCALLGASVLARGVASILQRRGRARTKAAINEKAPWEDRVDVASEDSFPASDPPAWTPTS